MAFTRKDVREDALFTIGQFPLFSGENEIGQEVIELAIRQAVNIFSRFFPDPVIEDKVGDGGKYYNLKSGVFVLTNWETGFSRVVSIDYDASTRVLSDEGVNFLDQDEGDWEFYSDASIDYIVFPNHSPTSDITLRVTYTRRQVLNDTITTIPDQYQEAILYLTVSQIAAIAQIRAEKALDPPAGAEFVTMRTKGSGFAAIRQAYYDFYIREIGGSQDGVGAASASKNYDQTPLMGGDYMFHPSRRR